MASYDFSFDPSYSAGDSSSSLNFNTPTFTTPGIQQGLATTNPVDMPVGGNTNYSATAPVDSSAFSWNSGGALPSTDLNFGSGANQSSGLGMSDLMAALQGFGGSNQSQPAVSPGMMWGSLGMQGLQTLGGIYSTLQQAKAARNMLDFQKQAYKQNFNQQAQTLNTAMEDRQNSRRSSSSSYQDTGSYMAQHGLKTI